MIPIYPWELMSSTPDTPLIPARWNFSPFFNHLHLLFISALKYCVLQACIQLQKRATGWKWFNHLRVYYSHINKSKNGSCGFQFSHSIMLRDQDFFSFALPQDWNMAATAPDTKSMFNAWQYEKRKGITAESVSFYWKKSKHSRAPSRLPLVTHWPEYYHMVTLTCKGG